jgi:radical SAM protein with 4Fe4S-binding SPASM domain
VKPNEHQVGDVLKLAADLEVDEVKFKSAQVYDFENGNPLIPENGKYSRYRLKSDGRWELKNKMENHCWRMWQGCVITWDGSLLPCCFDKDGHNKIGSLQQQNFRQIWNSQRYNDFRNAVLNNRKEIEICQNCTEGTEVFV